MEKQQIKDLNKEVTAFYKYNEIRSKKIGVEKLIAHWLDKWNNLNFLTGGKLRTQVNRNLADESVEGLASQFHLIIEDKQTTLDKLLDAQALRTGYVIKNKNKVKVLKHFAEEFKNKSVIFFHKDKPHAGMDGVKQMWDNFSNLTSNGHLYLSIHPVDMLAASSNSAFRTCYRLKGEYASGAVGSCIDKSSLMAYISEKKAKDIDMPYKTGRVFFYVTYNRSTNEPVGVITSKTYGSMCEEDIEQAKTMIMRAIAKKAGKKTWIKLGKDKTNLYKRVGYIDPNRKEYKLKAHRDVLSEAPILQTAVCITCGHTHSRTALTCGNCKEKEYDVECDSCGTGLYNSNSNTKRNPETNEPLCVDCFNNQFRRCTGCSTNYARTSMCTHAGNYWCAKCFTKHFTQCNDCNQFHNKGDLKKLPRYKGKNVCNSCLRDSYFPCNDCGEQTHIDDIYTDSSILDKLKPADSIPTLCEECTKTHNTKVKKTEKSGSKKKKVKNTQDSATIGQTTG